MSHQASVPYADASPRRVAFSQRAADVFLGRSGQFLALGTALLYVLAAGLDHWLATTITPAHRDLPVAGSLYVVTIYAFLAAAFGILAVNTGLALAFARRSRWLAYFSLGWMAAGTSAFAAYDFSYLPFFTDLFAALEKASGSVSNGRTNDPVLQAALGFLVTACQLIGNAGLALAAGRQGRATRLLALTFAAQAVIRIMEWAGFCQLVPDLAAFSGPATEALCTLRCVLAAVWFGQLRRAQPVLESSS